VPAPVTDQHATRRGQLPQQITALHTAISLRA
jgi:hypothetical protein